MIQAMIFDLDGTLVQTERLKAMSYARAVIELAPDAATETVILDAFKDVVGLSRKEVASNLLERFKIEDQSTSRMAEFGVSTPWQAFVQIRLRYYKDLIADPDVLKSNKWPHNISLLQIARQAKCKLGLATMSNCTQVQRILDILDLTNAFDFVASRDDVERGKPDPEIYHLVASELGIEGGECLVIEDSPAGVKAALGAGMMCIAVTTPYTREAIHHSGILDERWIVDNPGDLLHVVERSFAEHNQVVHSL